MKDNFIPGIVNFSTDMITEEIRKMIKSKYIANPDFTFEKVNRASLACGPMVKWVIAQISYADMLKRVEPLRNELKALESEASTKQMEGDKVEKLIKQLEKSIEKYKEEYGILISQAEAIKSSLKQVQEKVDRSVALLKSLGAERERWEAGSETFSSQMSTIIGDCLLTSSFMAYGGYFDQQMRHNLFSSWCQHLSQAKISYRADLARTEYLSDPDERLKWQANALPADELCVENAVMLKRYNRYPLIIDPSGQATEFIMNEYKDKKITKTSFLDDAFRKNLESALRFGNPLLVQDVESYDAILNPVLNKELRRTGGRILITLGDQDIDLSPSFTIFLSTRDPSVEFAPDLCSRVTFVNFTVTKSSLQSQCLNEVLKAEQPDVDQKRSDLLKLQGEFKLRLRQLEKSLLQALNDVKGRILDDDSIIATLETLKKEATEISQKVEETDAVIAEIEAVSQQYMPLSNACSSIYFTIESTHQVHFLYQYSLQFFLDIFHSVLYKNDKLLPAMDHSQRLSVITAQLFKTTFEQVARGMLHNDRIVFAMLLSRIQLKGSTTEPNFDLEFNHFLRGQEVVVQGAQEFDFFNSDQSEALVRLSSQIPRFANLAKTVSQSGEFKEWVTSGNPERNVPQLWASTEGVETTNISDAMNKLLAIQVFRPDRLISMSREFVISVLGKSFLEEAEEELNLFEIVENQIKGNTPILMCSVPGYDASGRVEDLAAEHNMQLSSIAIGSAEGFNEADKAINAASKAGRWVLLKNVHLAPQWLVQLEKKLHSIQPHAGFRLFLAMEIIPKIPTNLIRSGRVFVFEPPPGIKANLFRTFATVPAARMCKVPNERARLYFLLAWFHAIVQERLRYAPLGWSKKYEFGESDLRIACDTLDTWIDMVSMGQRTNLPPEKIPWDALCKLLSQSIYGGRIDNEFDQRLMNAFIHKLFTIKTFDGDFKLIGDDGTGKSLSMPDGIRREQFLQWVNNLSDNQLPCWLGLPNNAEEVLLTTRGTDLIGKMLKMQLLEDDDDLPEEATEKARRSSSVDGRPAWMRTLFTSASTWLKLVPKSLTPLKRTVENIKDPLFRYFEREVNHGVKLLNDVRNDLEEVIAVCQGHKKQTNYLRVLISELAKGMLPASWNRYTVPKSLTVITWMQDFSDRIKQLQKLSDAGNSQGPIGFKSIPVALGNLFIPEAYITATRQYVAQANHWSLEELHLNVTICGAGQKPVVDDCSFMITGLKLQGAESKNNLLHLSSMIQTDLHMTCLQWVRLGSDDAINMTGKVELPVYLNATRADLLFTVILTCEKGLTADHVYERGVALLSTTIA